jgi:hypothetical protein
VADVKANWVRDLVVIPLVVGMVVAVFTYGLPRIWEKGRQLSYSIDGPTPALTETLVGKIAISANGVPVSQLFTYRVRVWNSGGGALRDVPVRVVFEMPPADFRMLNVAHATTPKYEFGAITESSDSPASRRFVYALLNPKSEDVITFVTTAGPSARLYSNVEDVQLKEVATSEHKSSGDKLIALVGLAAAIASAMTSVAKTVATKREFDTRFAHTTSGGRARRAKIVQKR